MSYLSCSSCELAYRKTNCDERWCKLFLDYFLNYLKHI